MKTNPKVPNITLEPYPKARCVEFNGRDPLERKALSHPSSTNTRGGRRQNIWKK